MQSNAQTQPALPIDEQKLGELLGRAIGDMGAVSLAPLVLIGDELGLYRALAAGGPLTSAELARRTQTSERYIREWLNAHAASGYVQYLADSGRYRLTPEQAMLFADENSPAFIIGGFQITLAAGRIKDRLKEAFKTGAGIGWHEHDHDVFHGCGRFYRAGYIGNLVQHWIPSLDGVEARLKHGIRVADVGCGHGHSTVLMAQAFPKSQFVGYDLHAGSIDVARERARQAGVAARCTFEVGSAKDFAGIGFDFITIFDALHDLGDPVGAAKHVLSKLTPGGTWMIVEPYAGDRVEENLNPIGRAYYAGSTLMCTPCSLSQEVGLALGAQAGEARLREVVVGAGFSRFRRAMHTPVNLVFEARR
jgi:2-polyprenyl-3-methyl-5-hydroxy-6-metoxy-1,4-benzoquinol methylase